MKKISFIFGTRPEAIKLSPLILAMKEHPGFQTHVCVTGQHREMLDPVLHVFDIEPDVDLSLMIPDQSLDELTSRAIAAIGKYLYKHRPDMVIVQGDTTTVFCAALCAFYQQIPVGHVEAGLRTWNKHSPFPEEINRILTTRIADFHFAPTMRSQSNLLKEGVHPEDIYVTGNTVIDALIIAVEKIMSNQPDIKGLPTNILNNGSPIVLITGHRRENIGNGFANICNAVLNLATNYPDVAFVYPVHLNPNVNVPVHTMLGGIPNIKLIEPLSYLPFVALMHKAKIILTDSGGVQEEAPSLGKPVLVMRDTTERPEAIDAGAVKLIGTGIDSIVNNVSLLLDNNEAYENMAKAVNPYGDGKACERIIEVLEK